MDRLEELMQMRDRQRAELKGARMIVKFKDLQWEINRMGKMKWYLHPGIRDTAHHALIHFVQEIPPGSRTAKVQHQGGWTCYIWRGKGYSIINGKRYDWEAEDMLFFPVDVDNPLTYQHFNTDPEKPALLVVGIPNVVESLGVDLGHGFEILEECPEWRAQQARR